MLGFGALSEVALGEGSSASAPSGTLSATLGALTVSATATVSIQATASVTLGAVLSSGAAGLLINGALSQTLGALAASAAGGVKLQGVLSGTLDDATIVAAGGAPPINGVLSATLAAAVASGAAGIRVSGTLSKTLAAVTVSATATVRTLYVAGPRIVWLPPETRVSIVPLHDGASAGVENRTVVVGPMSRVATVPPEITFAEAA